MNKFILAAAAGLALLATPAAAGGYSHGHGSSHGHSSYSHSNSHSYGHSYHQPVHHSYYKPVHHSYQPTYQAHYVQPVHVEPKVTYEKRQAYVYQKVAGYCVDVVKSYGYNQHRKTVECKAGEYQKPEAKAAHVEPAPAPTPVEEAPQK